MQGKFTPVPFTNPTDATQVYSGRGRHPKWLLALENEQNAELTRSKTGEWTFVPRKAVEVAATAATATATAAAGA